MPMKKMSKFMCILAGLFIAAAVLLIDGQGVYAAPVTMPDGQVFDPDYYAQNNPDVVAVLGTDPAVLYQHYLLYGKAEGRKPYADATTGPSLAQMMAQRKLEVFKATIFHGRVYEDAVLTESGGKSYLHSRATGLTTYWNTQDTSYFGLTTDESYFFNYQKYAADYPAVAQQVGTSKQALWNHYKTVGVYQGLVAYSTSDNGNARLTCIYTLPTIIAGCNSQRDQVKAVHDWLIAHCDYDMENYQWGTIPECSYHIDGAILRGTCVCQGYSETFDYFMYLLGINCDIVSSSNHAWNRVAIEGQILALDVTWDDDNYQKGWTKPDYTYFLVSEAQMSRVQSHWATDYDPFYQ